MKHYTAAQWTLINLATHYGMDKDIFEDRLAWGRNVLLVLKKAKTFAEYIAITESYIKEADVPEEFAACAISVWDILQGEPTNYVIGLDACNSGAQIMSCMGRCIIGMKNTGLIDTGVRPDLYQEITNNVDGFDADRKLVKKGTVPHLYGSKREPKNVFGEDNYHAFLEACKKTMPWVEWIKDTLIPTWNSNATSHTVVMPDAGIAHMNVINKREYKGKFKGFNYSFYVDENTPKKFGEVGTTSMAA